MASGTQKSSYHIEYKEGSELITHESDMGQSFPRNV